MNEQRERSTPNYHKVISIVLHTCCGAHSRSATGMAARVRYEWVLSTSTNQYPRAVIGGASRVAIGRPLPHSPRRAKVNTQSAHFAGLELINLRTDVLGPPSRALYLLYCVSYPLHLLRSCRRLGPSDILTS